MMMVVMMLMVMIATIIIKATNPTEVGRIMKMVFLINDAVTTV